MISPDFKHWSLGFFSKPVHKMKRFVSLLVDNNEYFVVALWNAWFFAPHQEEEEEKENFISITCYIFISIHF